MKIKPEFENNPESNKMDANEKLDFLKAHASGRDPKTGRFVKGRTGNPKGRPKARTNTKDCLSLILSQKTIIEINGKKVRTNLLQAYHYKLVTSILSSDDPKILMTAFRYLLSNMDISKDMPESKIKPLKEDPSVEMIKNAIFNQIDEECGNNYNPDKMT